VQTIAITAVLKWTISCRTALSVVSAIFAHTDELAAVWKGAAKLTPEKAVSQIEPGALKYLHPGARKFFQEKGAVK
jgi:TRAP-type uncharacterized transport system substrate-binding protein